MNYSTVRTNLALPAAGVKTAVEVAGYTVLVEKCPDDTVSTIPLIRIETRDGSSFPAYSGAQYHFPNGFKRIFIEGTAATGTIYLLIVTSKGVQIVNPGTAT